MAKTLFNAVLRPPEGDEQSFEDADTGKERPLLREVTLYAESEDAALEIIREREAKQEYPYHVESIEAA